MPCLKAKKVGSELSNFLIKIKKFTKFIFKQSRILKYFNLTVLVKYFLSLPLFRIAKNPLPISRFTKRFSFMTHALQMSFYSKFNAFQELLVKQNSTAALFCGHPYLMMMMLKFSKPHVCLV